MYIYIMDYNGCLRDFRRKKDAGNVTSGCFRHLHISMEKCQCIWGSCCIAFHHPKWGVHWIRSTIKDSFFLFYLAIFHARSGSVKKHKQSETKLLGKSNFTTPVMFPKAQMSYQVRASKTLEVFFFVKFIWYMICMAWCWAMQCLINFFILSLKS